jgi:hypothetical protein
MSSPTLSGVAALVRKTLQALAIFLIVQIVGGAVLLVWGADLQHSVARLLRHASSLPWNDYVAAATHPWVIVTLTAVWIIGAARRLLPVLARNERQLRPDPIGLPLALPNLPGAALAVTVAFAVLVIYGTGRLVVRGVVLVVQAARGTVDEWRYHRAARQWAEEWSRARRARLEAVDSTAELPLSSAATP